MASTIEECCDAERSKEGHGMGIEKGWEVTVFSDLITENGC